MFHSFHCYAVQDFDAVDREQKIETRSQLQCLLHVETPKQLVGHIRDLTECAGNKICHRKRTTTTVYGGYHKHKLYGQFTEDENKNTFPEKSSLQVRFTIYE